MGFQIDLIAVEVICNRGYKLRLRAVVAAQAVDPMATIWLVT